MTCRIYSEYTRTNLIYFCKLYFIKTPTNILWYFCSSRDFLQFEAVFSVAKRCFNLSRIVTFNTSHLIALHHRLFSFTYLFFIVKEEKCIFAHFTEYSIPLKIVSGSFSSTSRSPAAYSLPPLLVAEDSNLKP